MSRTASSRSSRFLASGVFLVLAGCGGGGGSSGLGGSSNGSTASSQPALAAASAVVDGATIGAANWQTGSTSAGGQGQAVGGINCAVAGNKYTYTHLSILMNGTPVALPSGIGNVDPTLTTQTGCVYPLHTDDASGKIRMDATTNASYTLGQFFAIWGQPLSTSNVAGLQGQVAAYVNNGGAVTKYTGDLASLPLPAHGEVTLEIGTSAAIPTYTWTDPPPFDPNATTLTYGGTVGTVFWQDGSTSTGGTGADVDGITCSAGMAVNYHVHAHLAIVKNGQWLALPQQIGIPSQCNYEMHTHDRTGIIHIESPTAKTYTLGQFFDIWGQPLTSGNVAGVTGDVVAYINDNGDVRRYMGDPRNIPLISHRDVTLQVGTPAINTLATYTWTDEPQ